MMQRDTQQGIEQFKDLADEELVRQANLGELEAFSALYHRYLHMVYNRVRYRIPVSDVEDVTQEVFVSVLRSLQTFDGDSKFSTWLRTLTNRRIADYYRKRNEDQVELGVDVSEINPGSIKGNLAVASKTSAAEARIVVQRGLNALPEHYREVIVLRFAEGLKFREIAIYRGESLEATKSLFRRAIEFLRDLMEEPPDVH